MSQLRVFGLVILTLFTLVAVAAKMARLSFDNGRKSGCRAIAPHGQLVMAGQAVVSAVASAVRSGESIYASNCQGCHSSGVAGAPKAGGIAAWADRLTMGIGDIMLMLSMVLVVCLRRVCVWIVVFMKLSLRLIICLKIASS